MRTSVVVALACLAMASASEAFVAKVVSVADGDTLTVLARDRETRVRLSDIDAPEHGQPYGQAARRALAAFVAGRTIDVESRGADRHGRLLGRVRHDGLDVNAALVRDGYAWVYRAYAHDAALLALEREARAARRGLWRERDPVPPWVWRERQRAASLASDAAPLARRR